MAVPVEVPQVVASSQLVRAGEWASRKSFGPLATEFKTRIFNFRRRKVAEDVEVKDSHADL